MLNTLSLRAAVYSLILFVTAENAFAQAPGSLRPAYDTAAVRFVQGMMHHHAQAVVMSGLVPSRTSRQDIRTAARRIGVSQRDEIALMRRWLERKGQTVPEVDTFPPGSTPDKMTGMPMTGMPMTGMSMGGMPGDSAQHPHMPGMLTADQMSRLVQARGAKFDSLFLAYMVGHHQGALKMVADLFAAPGATDDPEIFQLASDIDADQRAEIARMSSMQKSKQLTRPLTKKRIPR